MGLKYQTIYINSLTLSVTRGLIQTSLGDPLHGIFNMDRVVSDGIRTLDLHVLPKH